MTTPNLRMYSMPELLDRLGLDYNYTGSTTAKMACPFCKRNPRKVKINIDLSKDGWRCPACGEAGYTLQFFSLYYLGIRLPQTAPQSDKSAAAKELRIFMEGTDNVQAAHNYERKPSKPTIPIAPDDQLDAVYSMMAKNPALQLLPKHRENLRKRGLSDEAIDRNGYRSLPEKMITDPFYTELFETAGGETRRNATVKWLTAKQIRFGLMVANSIISQGLSVQGVPGFFKFGEYWCYWCTPGILIPTRNIKGQIVIWQIRRDVLRAKDSTRYFTVSSGNLPGHVTDGVSRCHFPLGNAPLCADVPFLVTEGPLKADVACHLYPTAVTFAAIPGIQTTKDLMRHAPVLREAGITEIYNALDMDRLTNKNVRKGSDNLVNAFRDEQIRMIDMFWGVRFATSKLISASLIAKIRNVPYSTSGTNVFEQLRNVVSALDNAGITSCSFTDETNQEITLYWDPKTKGIDDYLLNSE